MKNMKRIAAMTLISVVLSGSALALAQEEKKADPTVERNRAGEIVSWEKDQDKQGKLKLKEGETLLQGQIVGYETCTVDSTMALFETADGAVKRVQLGKHGGRLLKLTPFEMKGVLKTDETGEYLDVTQVDYLDPDPYGEYRETQEKLAKAKGVASEKSLDNGRDVAYSHDNITSDDPTTLMQHSKDVDPADYEAAAIPNLKDLEKGTKVALEGRCVRTVDKDKDIVEFWDKDLKAVNLKMNGVYVPLGQHCTILGTVEEDGTVSVDAMKSAE